MFSTISQSEKISLPPITIIDIHCYNQDDKLTALLPANWEALRSLMAFKKWWQEIASGKETTGPAPTPPTTHSASPVIILTICSQSTGVPPFPTPSCQKPSSWHPSPLYPAENHPLPVIPSLWCPPFHQYHLPGRGSLLLIVLRNHI